MFIIYICQYAIGYVICLILIHDKKLTKHHKHLYEIGGNVCKSVYS